MRVEEIPQAVAGTNAVLLAIPGGAIASLLDAYAAALDGKLLLDASNHMAGERFHQIDLFEARVPRARWYRAFNTLGWENIAEPVFEGQRADLFYSGPDGDDRPAVETLIRDVGLRPVYGGSGSQAADVLDGMTRLWFTLALQLGHGRHLAFMTLGLSPPLGA